MITRPVPDRRGPQKLAFVQVDRGQSRVGRLEQRQAIDRQAARRVRAGTAHSISKVRCPGIGRGHLHDVRRRSRRNVQDAGLRIECGSAPVRTAERTR